MAPVTKLSEGSTLVSKQMKGASEEDFPGHTASEESTLVVTSGSVILRFDDEDVPLEVGDAHVIPADKWHRVVPNPEFTAVHSMPKTIRFDFRRQ